MKKLLTTLALTVLPASVSAATLNGGEWLRYTVTGEESTSITFSLPTEGLSSYRNFGGYVKWSEFENGWTTANNYAQNFEMGHSGGSWNLVFDPWGQSVTQSSLLLDFGKVIETAYVWVRSTHGSGNLEYLQLTAEPGGPGIIDGGNEQGEPVNPAAVPLPGAVMLLLSGIAGLVLMRRRQSLAA